ncbi:MAG: hypothetical protein Solivirus6_4 [Solivirus sp.]|uniref:Uncharacterized protein n=1 Tax=Solivirus sp. TaxID=2487772 RepID=A0A3G5AFW2_9VIRU|nr:MAG: hypothetical protein Solivirus6_4 [Solivirus sp.]
MELDQDLQYLSNIPPNSLCCIKTKTYTNLGSLTSLLLRKYWYRETKEDTIAYLNTVYLNCYEQCKTLKRNTEAHKLKLQLELSLVGLQYLRDSYKIKYGVDDSVIYSIDEKTEQFTKIIDNLSRKVAIHCYY